jgi:hypothetical protein
VFYFWTISPFPAPGSLVAILPVRQLLLSGRLYTTSFSSIPSNSWIFELEHAGMIKQGLIIPWLGYS